jgi:hypothetical protein
MWGMIGWDGGAFASVVNGLNFILEALIVSPSYTGRVYLVEYEEVCMYGGNESWPLRSLSLSLRGGRAKRVIVQVVGGGFRTNAFPVQPLPSLSLSRSLR